MRRKNQDQLTRILRAQAEVNAEHARYPADGQGGREAATKISRAAAVRDRALDNASRRTERRALRIIAGG